MKPANDFCTCEDFSCKLHPVNHTRGCDPCIEKNLKAGEIPSCFFRSLNPDLSEVKDFTTEDFVAFYLKQQNKT
ncbi:hypothetical protein ISALK_09330 [Isachenkonia alkalipeptolytica]|uniref:Uncharacterized protein n=2 Tax=Isachenkonia alkalipeptolytica TaxID=2565777 RepID=A0AA43XLT7_9CLOT|nr:hypothetical protein [Isachenkonia alkalipeptolytica]